MISIYGLKNCDTCRAALKWLEVRRELRHAPVRGAVVHLFVGAPDYGSVWISETTPGLRPRHGSRGELDAVGTDGAAREVAGRRTDA